MLEDPVVQQQRMMERYVRARRRALLVAVAACALAGGVLLGVWLSGRHAAKAGDGTSPHDLTSAFVDIARQVEPAVVNISTVTRAVDRVGRGLSDSHSQLDLPPFGRDRGARRGTGSGVIVDPQGYILTNHHVIEGADRIKVKLYDGTELEGRVVGSDTESDLAVVKISTTVPLVAARLGDSDKARVGDWVLAIGSPFGLDQTVTAGIISAKDREANELGSNNPRSHYLQTDAAINRGNSGGPLINLTGEVIGINTAIATSTGDYNGIGFAFPSSEAVAVYSQLVKHGNVVRGFLGVIPERVTPQIAKVYGLLGARGAIISNVTETMETRRGKVESTPAFKAGLRRNDIVLEYRGERVKDEMDFIRRVAATPVGTTAPIKVYRDGKELTLNAVISRRPEAAEENSEAEEPGDKVEKVETQALGLTLAMLTPQQATESRLGDARGVVIVQVESGSIAEDAGLRRNDVIETVNREPVANNDQFQRALGRIKSGDPVVLQIVTRSQRLGLSRRFVSFTKP